jgi:hypothetical protein
MDEQKYLQKIYLLRKKLNLQGTHMGKMKMYSSMKNSIFSLSLDARIGPNNYFDFYCLKRQMISKIDNLSSLEN